MSDLPHSPEEWRRLFSRSETKFLKDEELGCGYLFVFLRISPTQTVDKCNH